MNYAYIKETMKQFCCIPVRILLAVLLVTAVSCNRRTGEYRMSSPDGSLELTIRMGTDSMLYYSLTCQGQPMLRDSRLGLVRDDADFSRHLILRLAGPVEKDRGSYALITGKKKECSWVANCRSIHVANQDGMKMEVGFLLANDGLAYRYRFQGGDSGTYRIRQEVSSFDFPPGTKCFIQPRAVAGTGWSNTQPSYEEFYRQGITPDSLSENKGGWVMPALFKTPGGWLLLSETAPVGSYCGSHLSRMKGENGFRIAFPDEREAFPGGPVLPTGRLPWDSPWRIVASGSDLGDIVESTLGTDLAAPCVISDPSWVRPGRASWSWALLKDPSVNYKIQQQFIDYASSMGWEYCLVDVNWDRNIGYDSIARLARYAAERNVGLLLWYNSSGDWNTTVYTPKSKLIDREKRREEFGRLRDMGIKGIKVDFFGGDGQSMMNYYRAIFEDAAEFGLAVNCHGATFPRGWQRTHPNLLTMEAVRGFEFVTFEQANADRQANHCCMLPFTRNVFDPMDYTPVCFSEIPGIRRRTTNAFELALSVIFWSGLQHFAVIPSSMEAVPEEVKDFMSGIPSVWDETRFLEGYPGKYAVLARRSGDRWYVAGINAGPHARDITLKTDFLRGSAQGRLFTDKDDRRSFNIRTTENGPDMEITINMDEGGGFVLCLEQQENQ